MRVSIVAFVAIVAAAVPALAYPTPRYVLREDDLDVLRRMEYVRRGDAASSYVVARHERPVLRDDVDLLEFLLRRREVPTLEARSLGSALKSIFKKKKKTQQDPDDAPPYSPAPSYDDDSSPPPYSESI